MADATVDVMGKQYSQDDFTQLQSWAKERKPVELFRGILEEEKRVAVEGTSLRNGSDNILKDITNSYKAAGFAEGIEAVMGIFDYIATMTPDFEEEKESSN